MQAEVESRETEIHQVEERVQPADAETQALLRSVHAYCC